MAGNLNSGLSYFITTVKLTTYNATATATGKFPRESIPFHIAT